MQNRRYPKLHIQSKNELAKHISHSKFSKEDALALINTVTKNFDQYWKDNKKKSEPKKEKYVRSAKTTPLGRLLDMINKIILAPHDNMLPNFIFGGVKGQNHAKAVKHLLGKKRRRVLLKLDIERFFEQVKEKRVYHFFRDKCECTDKVAKMLAGFCCVPIGPKGITESQKAIARGFATSSRLAVWCNIETFIKLDQLVKKRLKGKDPRIIIYVDDIGITASRVSKDEMEVIFAEARNLLLTADGNQKLPLNMKKKEIKSHEEGMEILGIRMYRNRLSVGSKTKSKIDEMKNKSKKELSHKDVLSIKGLARHKKYIENL